MMRCFVHKGWASREVVWVGKLCFHRRGSRNVRGVSVTQAPRPAREKLPGDSWKVSRKEHLASGGGASESWLRPWELCELCRST